MNVQAIKNNILFSLVPLAIAIATYYSSLSATIKKYIIASVHPFIPTC